MMCLDYITGSCSTETIKRLFEEQKVIQFLMKLGSDTETCDNCYEGKKVPAKVLHYFPMNCGCKGLSCLLKLCVL